jgi:hypothetical protein
LLESPFDDLFVRRARVFERNRRHRAPECRPLSRARRRRKS